jgi:hypothetical protein
VPAEQARVITTYHPDPAACKSIRKRGGGRDAVSRLWSNDGSGRHYAAVQSACRTIIIIKGVPVWQCGSCSEYMLEDVVMAPVDSILAHVNAAAELEVIECAA